MEEAERRVALRYDQVGINVGLNADYGAAQVLYVRRGYVPEGGGVHYRGQPITPGAAVGVDDDLLFSLIKRLA